MNTSIMDPARNMKSSDSLGQHVKFNTVYDAALSQSVVVKNSVHSSELSLSSSQSQSSGWGNAESRKTYTCLASLVDEGAIPNRQVVPVPIDVEGYGYFIDTQDNW